MRSGQDPLKSNQYPLFQSRSHPPGSRETKTMLPRTCTNYYRCSRQMRHTPTYQSHGRMGETTLATPNRLITSFLVSMNMPCFRQRQQRAETAGACIVQVERKPQPYYVRLRTYVVNVVHCRTHRRKKQCPSKIHRELHLQQPVGARQVGTFPNRSAPKNQSHNARPIRHHHHPIPPRPFSIKAGLAERAQG